MLRIVYLVVCFTLLLCFSPNIESSNAVSKSVKAKSEFMLADKLFNEKNYSGAIEHAEKAKSLLGKSNSRIELMLTKAHYAQKQYDRALVALEAFFNVTPESMSGSDEYIEMVSLYAQVETSVEKQKKQLVAKKKQEIARQKRLPPVLQALPQQMVAVSCGCFHMGNSDTSIESTNTASPVHWVCVDNFSIGKYEVTQELWTAVMGSNPSYLKSASHPVDTVSWDDVQQFLRKLNSKTDKHYRLPTEAEWEYAASSGGKNEKYSGGSNLDRVAWYDKNSGDKTHPVGKNSANGLGLYDMSGNVWEWCQDWYGKTYYQDSPSHNPKGPSLGEYRVRRGGCLFSQDKTLRTSDRSAVLPDDRWHFLGFRLVHP